jgi:hypothetical protein
VRDDEVHGAWTALGWPEPVFRRFHMGGVPTWMDEPDEDDLAAASLPSWSHAVAEADGS